MALTHGESSLLVRRPSGKQPRYPFEKPVLRRGPRIYALFFDSDGTLAPALEPNRAAAALAQPSKILPVVAPIPPAQFNPGNTIKWNKVL